MDLHKHMRFLSKAQNETYLLFIDANVLFTYMCIQRKHDRTTNTMRMTTIDYSADREFNFLKQHKLLRRNYDCDQLFQNCFYRIALFDT